MIQHPQQRRRINEARNQVALEVLMVIYALAATAIIVRTIVLLLGISDRIWIGRVIYGATSVVTDPLQNVPGFGTQLVGPLTMVDLLLLAVVILVPLGLLASSPRA